MLRTLLHEAAALAAIGLFVSALGVWAGVLGGDFIGRLVQ